MMENPWRAPPMLHYIRDILVELQDLAGKAEEPELAQLCAAAAEMAGARLLARRGNEQITGDHEDGAAA